MNSFKTVNTIFAKNIVNTFTVITNLESKNTIIIQLYSQLNEYVTIVNEILNLFSSGKRDEVIEIFTEEFYLDLSLKLVNLEVDPQKYPEYEKTRLSLVAALRALRTAITINTELKNKQVTNNEVTTELTQIKQLLSDPVSLQTYLNDFKNRGVIFPDMNIEVPMATLYPEYAEYIRVYGYDGSFEPDKLAAIKNKLNII